MIKRTLDGLPIVSEETFLEFLKNYNLIPSENDPEVNERIKNENPQIYGILHLGMENAPTKEARSYYEYGMRICYELLRMQGASDYSKMIK
jgi:hypothetical protein